MCQTLFTIPPEIAGLPVFGVGWVLGLWVVLGIVYFLMLARRLGWSSAAGSFLPVLVIGAAAITFLFPGMVQADGLPIRGYGVMLLVALCSAVGLSLYRAWQRGVDPEVILSLSTWLIIAGIVGARLFYVIEYWDQWFKRPTVSETLKAVVNITQGGLVVYGATLAGGLALFVFVRRYRLPGLAMADLVAPSLLLGMGLGRLGCFLNGCCFGGVSDLPWAVSFPWNTPPHIAQAEQGMIYLHGIRFKGLPDAPPVIESLQPDSQAERAGLRPGQVIVAIGGAPVDTIKGAQLRLLSVFGDGATVSISTQDAQQPKMWRLAGLPPRSLPVHPTQLYDLIVGLLLCLFLLAYDPYRRRDGELTALALTIYPISRFLIEIIRVDESSVFHTGLSISQNISILVLAGGCALWAYLAFQPRRAADAIGATSAMAKV